MPTDPEGVREQDWRPPDPVYLARGGLLAGLGLGLAWGARTTLRRAGILALPAALLLATGALLSGWAALIQITGGAQHDDHPFL